VVIRGTIGLLSPYVVRVGVEIAARLSTCATDARVKYVRAVAAVGYLTEYRAAVCPGTQGKRTYLLCNFIKSDGLLFCVIKKENAKLL